MYFIEEFARQRICLFRYMLFSSSFYTTVVSNGLHEPYLLLTNSSFILILSDSHRGCLIWVKFVKIPKQKFESQHNVILIKYAVSTNQSVRYKETLL